MLSERWSVPASMVALFTSVAPLAEDLFLGHPPGRSYLRDELAKVLASDADQIHIPDRNTVQDGIRRGNIGSDPRA